MSSFSSSSESRWRCSSLLAACSFSFSLCRASIWLFSSWRTRSSWDFSDPVTFSAFLMRSRSRDESSFSRCLKSKEEGKKTYDRCIVFACTLCFLLSFLLFFCCFFFFFFFFHFYAYKLTFIHKPRIRTIRTNTKLMCTFWNPLTNLVNKDGERKKTLLCLSFSSLFFFFFFLFGGREGKELLYLHVLFKVCMPHHCWCLCLMYFN